MAAQNSFSLEEEELSCPICFEEFNLSEKNRQPKLLLCLHTFCLACVETLRKYDGSLQCSICRTSHQVFRVGDLMDNYVIFDHLRVKQEYEDGKLATQLKEEYDASLRLLEEQEERDAQLAREEEEKNRLEEERRKQEEERRKQEEEKRKQEEQRKKEEEGRERLRFEEERVSFEEERVSFEEERVSFEEERLKKEEERRRWQEEIIRREEEEEKKRLEEYAQLSRPFMEEEIPDEVDSSSESPDTGSEETTDTENEEMTEEEGEEEPFQEVAQTENDDEDDDEESQTSIVDGDDYETLSSDTDRCSIEILSSDDEDEMGTALSTTAPIHSKNQHASQEQSPSTSPEPDLLSEEFSGVAQSNNTSSKPQETLSKLLPSVKCAERSDGSIIIINDSTDEMSTEGETPSPYNTRKCVSVTSFAAGLTVSTDESEGDDPQNYSSEDEEEISLSPPNVIKQRPLVSRKDGMSTPHENDENCKLQ